MPVKRHEVTSLECKKFNEVREEYKNKLFTKNEIQAILKERVGWYIGNTFFTLLIKGESSPIKQINKSEYTFSDKPVYITKLQSILKQKQDKQTKYNRVARANRKEKTTTPQKAESFGLLAQIVEPKTITEDEQKAIALLKSYGYVIFKPETKYIKI